MTATGDALTHAYTRVVLPILRGEYSAGDTPSPDMADLAARALGDHGDPAFGMRLTDHCDQSGQVMPAEVWAAMRTDDDYTEIGTWECYLGRTEATDRSQRFEFLLEWVGACVQVGRPEQSDGRPIVSVDVGPMLSVRFVSSRSKGASPWMTLRHWPRGGEGLLAAVNTCQEIFASTGDAGDAAKASPAQHAIFEEVIDRWGRLGAVDSFFDGVAPRRGAAGET